MSQWILLVMIEIHSCLIQWVSKSFQSLLRFEPLSFSEPVNLFIHDWVTFLSFSESVNHFSHEWITALSFSESVNPFIHDWVTPLSFIESVNPYFPEWVIPLSFSETTNLTDSLLSHWVSRWICWLTSMSFSEPVNLSFMAESLLCHSVSESFDSWLSHFCVIQWVTSEKLSSCTFAL